MIKKLIYFGLVMMIIFSFTACGDNETPEERIERLTGMELPTEIEEVYYYYSQDFHGSFRLYAIYKLSEEPADFLSEYLFTEAPRVHSTNTDHFSKIIPEEYYLYFEGERYLYRHNFVEGGGGAGSAYFPEKLMLLFRIEMA